jgi:hypothetical protein
MLLHRQSQKMVDEDANVAAANVAAWGAGGRLSY